MRRLLLLLILVTMVMSPMLAQDAGDGEVGAPGDQPDYTVNVFVDSALIRALPTTETDFIGSVFEGDVLVAVGRNTDGTWFHVRRPYRAEPGGWIFYKLVAYSFDMGALPITDFVTSVTGPTPVLDSGVAAYILTEAAIRAEPNFNSERVAIIPVLLTVPIIERSPDNLWLYVNYNGQTGWVAEFLTRIVGDVENVPVSTQFPGLVIDLPIIPPEVQLAQVNRLRAYIRPKYALAEELSGFWSLVSEGQTVPCNPPAGYFPLYDWSSQDVVELPELRRYVRRLDAATLDLNETIADMQRCGIYTAEEISSAYAGAVNASIIYRVVLNNLDFLEEEVIH